MRVHPVVAVSNGFSELKKALCRWSERSTLQLHFSFILFRLDPECTADIGGILAHIEENKHFGTRDTVVEELKHIPKTNRNPGSIARCCSREVNLYARHLL